MTWSNTLEITMSSRHYCGHDWRLKNRIPYFGVLSIPNRFFLLFVRRHTFLSQKRINWYSMVSVQSDISIMNWRIFWRTNNRLGGIIRENRVLRNIEKHMKNDFFFLRDWVHVTIQMIKTVCYRHLYKIFIFYIQT